MSNMDWRNKAGVTVEEAAKLLSIGRSTAWVMVREGQLESFKIGKLRRIVPASVERLMGRTSASKQAA